MSSTKTPEAKDHGSEAPAAKPSISENDMLKMVKGMSKEQRAKFVETLGKVESADHAGADKKGEHDPKPAHNKPGHANETPEEHAADRQEKAAHVQEKLHPVKGFANEAAKWGVPLGMLPPYLAYMGSAGGGALAATETLGINGLGWLSKVHPAWTYAGISAFGFAGAYAGQWLAEKAGCARLGRLIGGGAGSLGGLATGSYFLGSGFGIPAGLVAPLAAGGIPLLAAGAGYLAGRYTGWPKAGAALGGGAGMLIAGGLAGLPMTPLLVPAGSVALVAGGLYLGGRLGLKSVKKLKETTLGVWNGTLTSETGKFLTGATTPIWGSLRAVTGLYKGIIGEAPNGKIESITSAPGRFVRWGIGGAIDLAKGVREGFFPNAHVPSFKEVGAYPGRIVRSGFGLRTLWNWGMRPAGSSGGAAAAHGHH